MKTLDEYFKDWEGHVFGFGYGTGEDFIIPVLYEFITNMKDGRTYHHKDVEQKHGPVVAWLLINILCHADILEYGTSPRGGWLTKEGEKLRDYMKSKTPEEIILLLEFDEKYVGCGPDYCNCEKQNNPCKNPFYSWSMNNVA